MCVTLRVLPHPLSPSMMILSNALRLDAIVLYHPPPTQSCASYSPFLLLVVVLREVLLNLAESRGGTPKYPVHTYMFLVPRNDGAPRKCSIMQLLLLAAVRLYCWSAGVTGGRERPMTGNGRHALLVFLLGVSHAEAFFRSAATPFRRRAMVREQSTSTACFEGRGVGDASPRLESEQDVLPPHFRSADSVAWVQLMLDSFEETFAGQPLIRGLERESSSPEEQARQVAVADVAMVSHDFQRSADDPIFIYGARRRMADSKIGKLVHVCSAVHIVGTGSICAWLQKRPAAVAAAAMTTT